MIIYPFLHPPSPPEFNNFQEVTAYTRRIWETILRLRQGKTENVTEITLTASAATTVFTDKRLSIQSAILFDPKTANAAAELYAGTMYVLTANRTTGIWTITHANNVQADRTFQVAIVG